MYLCFPFLIIVLHLLLPDQTLQKLQKKLKFNAANKTISLSAGVHYLDITSISREAKHNSLLIASDSLHPSAYQYEQWSLLLALMMQQKLH